MPMNKQGGFNFARYDEIRKAKKADLLTLPLGVKGTNCFNCKFIVNGVGEDEDRVGFCSNPWVRVMVTNRMCCALWGHKKALNSWEK